jgi:hypothetical protein
MQEASQCPWVCSERLADRTDGISALPDQAISLFSRSLLKRRMFNWSENGENLLSENMNAINNIDAVLDVSTEIGLEISARETTVSLP